MMCTVSCMVHGNLVEDIFATPACKKYRCAHKQAHIGVEPCRQAQEASQHLLENTHQLTADNAHPETMCSSKQFHTHRDESELSFTVILNARLPPNAF